MPVTALLEVLITDTVLPPDSVTHTSVPSGVAATANGLLVEPATEEASARVETTTDTRGVAGTADLVIEARDSGDLAEYGIGFVASQTQHTPRPGVVYRRLTGTAPEMTIGIGSHPAESSSALRTFLDIAVAVGATLR